MDNPVKRAKEIAFGAPENLRDRALELALNVLWMEGKLEEARAGIGDAPLTIAYDNGGGQKGVRKNPALEAYTQLMAGYTRALKQLCELVGVEEADDGDDMLDAIIAGSAPTRQARTNL